MGRLAKVNSFGPIDRARHVTYLGHGQNGRLLFTMTFALFNSWSILSFYWCTFELDKLEGMILQVSGLI